MLLLLLLNSQQTVKCPITTYTCVIIEQCIVYNVIIIYYNKLKRLLLPLLNSQ